MGSFPLVNMGKIQILQLLKHLIARLSLFGESSRLIINQIDQSLLGGLDERCRQKEGSKVKKGLLIFCGTWLKGFEVKGLR